MRAPVVVLIAVGCIWAGIAEPACSSPVGTVDDSATLITTLGRDTVAMESFTRTASQVEGHIAVRFPGTVLIHYVVDLDGHGVPTHSLVDVMPLGTSEVAARRVRIDFRGDSAFVDVDSMGHHKLSRVALESRALPELITGFGPSFGLYESPVLIALNAPVTASSVGDTVRVTTFDIVRGRPDRRVFVRRSASTVDADFFGIAWTHVSLDGAGKVESVDASETTERTRTTRANYMDVEAEAQRFADADRAGNGLGLASPPKVERGIVGGTTVVVSYASPRRRGRDILGKVVPYGEIWRTGANEATTLFSDKSLEIGGTPIPAGVYSVWTLPRADGTVDLIINSQHGQWGTDHDSKLDVAHVPMTVTSSNTPTDEFAITLTRDATPSLRIAWDRFVWSVPVTIAK